MGIIIIFLFRKMQQIQTIEKCSGQIIVYLDYLVVLSLIYPRHGSLSCITKYLSKTIIFQAHVRLWCDVKTKQLYDTIKEYYENLIDIV